MCSDLQLRFNVTKLVHGNGIARDDAQQGRSTAPVLPEAVRIVGLRRAPDVATNGGFEALLVEGGAEQVSDRPGLELHAHDTDALPVHRAVCRGAQGRPLYLTQKEAAAILPDLVFGRWKARYRADRLANALVWDSGGVHLLVGC